jgi:hypothetical protein
LCKCEGNCNFVAVKVLGVSSEKQMPVDLNKILKVAVYGFRSKNFLDVH